MSEHDSEINHLSRQLHQQYQTEPTHLESGQLVADEVGKLAAHPTMLETPHVIEYMQPDVIGEVIENTGEVIVPTKEVQLGVRGAQVIHGELEPFGYRVLMMRGGRKLEGNIVASIAYDDEGGRCEVIRDENGNNGVATISGEGKVTRSANVNSYSTKVRAGLGDVYLTHTDTAEDKWTIEYRADRENERGAQLSVAETVSVQAKSEVMKESKEKERAEKRSKWLKRAIGAGAIYLTLMPGGMIDSVADQFTTSKETISSSAEALKPDFETLDSERDGIPLREYPNAEAELAKANGEKQAAWEKTLAASEVVESTMDNLDNHEYQSIIDKALEYQASHTESILSSETTAETFDALEQAETKEEVLAAVDKLEDFYGYNFHASEAVSFEALKRTVSATAEGLVVLPKTLTEKAALTDIYFETTEEVMASTGDKPGVAAYYSFDKKEIHMGSVDTVSAIIKDVGSKIPGSQGGGYDEKTTFIHEFGHALDAGDADVGFVEFDTHNLNNPLDTVRDTFVGGILSTPQVISTYSRANHEESYAENISGVLSDRPDGLAHPDTVRQFTSPANQTLLSNLIRIEASDPGLANYLVAQNDRLMRGQTLGTQ